MYDHHVVAWRLHVSRLRISDVPRPTSKGPHMLVSEGGVMRWVKRPKGWRLGEATWAQLLGLGDDVSDEEANRMLLAGEITKEIAAKGHAERREKLKKALEKGRKHSSKAATSRVTKEMLEEAYLDKDASGNGNAVRDHLKGVKAYLLKRYGITMKEETISAELHRYGIRKQAKRKLWPE
jgi:hypothetical protein